MKPILKFLTADMEVSALGEEACVPDIWSGINIQNKGVFELDEEDEIFEGYGRLETSYPYRRYNCYDRKLFRKEVRTAVLENDFLYAEFLPEYGGRLWKLIDKTTGRNLLYTNDCIRPSNLAARDAWFSGGVEWNIGIIGHTPYTMDPLFTAGLEDQDNNPVLRMYEYERIRRTVYQMDFWLSPDSRFLNCRMRIVNDSDTVVPMYWWSNMAVPEYDQGRVIVPAEEAYTCSPGKVYKVKLPEVNGIDITRYGSIPNQVDYFFNIPQERRKYIANLDHQGYGLLHLSTARLRSRKLFSWGHNQGSARWQAFLTKNAGNYVEIQAGLGKTQYGCVPMAPHTAWEWLEQYGAVKMEPDIVACPFEKAKETMEKEAAAVFEACAPEEKLKATKPLAKQKAVVVYEGSGYASLENDCRKEAGEVPMSPHLDFSSHDTRQNIWREFMEAGGMPRPAAEERPEDFTADDRWFQKLSETVKGRDRENWYAHYHLGLQFLYRRDIDSAYSAFRRSNELTENVWAQHGAAVCLARTGRLREAVQMLYGALVKRRWDLSFVKEVFRIMIALKAYPEVLSGYELLDERLQSDNRLYFAYIQALYGTGEYQKAMRLFEDAEDMEIADIREGEDALDKLWSLLAEKVYPGKEIPIPANLSFRSFY